MRYLNRRNFLATAGAAVAAAGAVPFLWRAARAEVVEYPADGRLAMPPLLDTRATGRVSLTAQYGSTSFGGGPASQTAGYNQGFLGPTLVVQRGGLAAEVANGLSEDVSVHWHGLLVPGEHDGGPHSPIRPGGSWRPEMSIEQAPATAWYHSHIHGRTAPHVYAGLTGVLQLSDGRDDERGLPSAYGVDDLTLIIQDRRFDEAGRMIYSPTATDILNGFHGNRMTVNGQLRATAVVPRGIVRLRLLNGSNARIYTLGFTDRRTMHLVGTDGGYIHRPQAIEFLRISPGERAEVLVDFSAGGETVMTSIRGPLRILDFSVDETLPARITRLPDELDEVPDDLERSGVVTRQFSLNMGGGPVTPENTLGGANGGHAQAAHDSGAHHHGAQVHEAHGGAEEMAGHGMRGFGINGSPYDANRIDFDVPIGTVERWVISGGGGVDHPFHVHGVHFRVLRAGGMAPGPENSGWKDTVLMSGPTEILTRFTHPAGRDHPYMYHCHILEHEDAGMMGQFTVT